VGENVSHLFVAVMLRQGQASVPVAKGRGDKTPWLAKNLSKNG